MIKVSDLNKTNDISSSKGKKSSSGADFSSFLKNNVPNTSNAVSGLGSISIADAIFATQMVDGDEEKEARRQLIKRGKSLLDKLEEIRLAQI